MNTVAHSINKTFKRLRVFLQLDMMATFALRCKCKLEGWASVYVYPKNRVKVSKEASIHVVNGLMTFSKPWFEVVETGPCVFEMEKASKLDCNGSFDFVRGSKCIVKEGATLSLGDGGRLGKGSQLLCNHEISIGAHCWISDNVTVSDIGKLVIEDGVWIGNGVTIQGNLRIGKGAVIDEGMCVVDNVKEFEVLKN